MSDERAKPVQGRPTSVLGAFIRQQRELADMSMRQMSAMVGISNPYLSQIERGLRAPSEAVVAGIATTLGISVDELYERAGYVEPERAEESASDLMEAIVSAAELTSAQRTAMLEIYRSFLDSNRLHGAAD